MKTASVRDLRNHYMSVLRWIDAGEEILITKRGTVIARLSPETEKIAGEVSWKNAPEVKRNRKSESVLDPKKSLTLIHDAGGKW